MWTPSEVSCGVADSTVRMLTDVLWYIDGQLAKLSERSCEIPVIFHQFTGRCLYYIIIIYWSNLRLLGRLIA